MCVLREFETVMQTRDVHDVLRLCKHLKEQCHEDFAVVGQLCVKIITLRLDRVSVISKLAMKQYLMR